MTLYCGYAYESELVAKSFQTAVPAALFFAAMALLLALFAAQALQGKPDLGTLCGALLAFFALTRRLDLSLLPNVPFGPLPVDTEGLAGDLSLTLLMVFLASRLTGWRRWVVGLFALAQGMTVAVHTALNATGQLTFFWVRAVPAIGLAGLAAALACGVLEWKRSWFFRVFCLLTPAGAIAWAAPGPWKYFGSPLSIRELPRYPLTLLPPLTGIITAAALVTALTEAARREIARRTEARLLAQRFELAQSSYEALRRQHEQVMMLRHDMMKHFQVLRQTTTDEKTAAYLDELIGENEKIRPVVRSGNEMLDVILNGKLSAAADAGIAVELARTQAPDWIHKETAPERGLGLKVVRQIAERYGNLFDTEFGDGYYRVTVPLSLRQLRK